MRASRAAPSTPAPSESSDKRNVHSANARGSVRFFAIRVGTDVRTNLDACEICGPIGYFLEGGAAVCRNCTSPIALSSLGRRGGCNPIPVRSHIDGSRVVLDVSDLAAAAPLAKGR